MLPTLLNSYLSIYLLTSLTTFSYLVKIHLSDIFKLSKLTSFKEDIFIKQNLEAFQSLLIKFQVDLTFSSS